MEAVFAELGFSERETKVYLALLDLSESTVGPIAAKTRIQHTKVYPTLEKLIDRGLVSFVLKGRVKWYQAEDPRHILRIIKDKERALNEILPQLELRRKFAQQQQIAKIYEGYNAIVSLYENLFDMFDKNGYYYVFGFRGEYTSAPLAIRFFRTMHARFAEKRVDDRFIGHVSVRKQIMQTYASNTHMQIRFTRGHFPLGLAVTNERVINLVWGERPTAVEIVSPQIAAQYKHFFLDMWHTAKR